jgi:hypothetical protein
LMLAMVISRLLGGAKLTPLTARLLATLCVNQSTLSFSIGALLMSGGATKSEITSGPALDLSACRTMKAMAPLARLPKGFAVASVDLGPFIVAHTRIDVYSAPYHRLEGAIVESYRVLRSSPEISEQKLRALDADYLIACVAVTKAGEDIQLEDGVSRDSLIGRLTFGETMPFLDELKDPTGEPSVRVWRVKRRDE